MVLLDLPVARVKTGPPASLTILKACPPTLVTSPTKGEKKATIGNRRIFFKLAIDGCQCPLSSAYVGWNSSHVHSEVTSPRRDVKSELNMTKGVKKRI